MERIKRLGRKDRIAFFVVWKSTSLLRRAHEAQLKRGPVTHGAASDIATVGGTDSQRSRHGSVA